MTAVSPMAQQRIAAASRMLAGRGIGVGHGFQTGLAAIWGSVARQSMVISYERIFLLGGLLFLAVLPLLVFMKVDMKSLASEMHLE